MPPGARFPLVLPGNVWNGASMSTRKMQTEAFVHWVGLRGLRVAPGMVDFPHFPAVQELGLSKLFRAPVMSGTLNKQSCMTLRFSA